MGSWEWYAFCEPHDRLRDAADPWQTTRSHLQGGVCPVRQGDIIRSLGSSANRQHQNRAQQVQLPRRLVHNTTSGPGPLRSVIGRWSGLSKPPLKFDRYNLFGANSGPPRALRRASQPLSDHHFWLRPDKPARP